MNVPVVTAPMLAGLEIGQQFDTPPILGGFNVPVTWKLVKLHAGVEYVFDLTCLGVALCSVVATVYAGDVLMEEI